MDEQNAGDKGLDIGSRRPDLKPHNLSDRGTDSEPHSREPSSKRQTEEKSGVFDRRKRQGGRNRRSGPDDQVRNGKDEHAERG